MAFCAMFGALSKSTSAIVFIYLQFSFYFLLPVLIYGMENGGIGLRSPCLFLPESELTLMAKWVDIYEESESGFMLLSVKYHRKEQRATRNGQVKEF